MPTRRQNSEEREFRQDAFASSAEHDRGSLGNLVAARCHKLTDPEEIAMLWWLQQVSWRDGGLQKFAHDFLTANQSRIGTPSMHKYGMKPGQIYNAEQVRQIRSELNELFPECRFPLQGEVVTSSDDYIYDMLSDRATQSRAARDSRSVSHPASYAAAVLKDHCAISVSSLSDLLARSLVDPASDSLRQGLWNFPGLWAALFDWQKREIEASKAGIVETEITRTISEELDFALHSRSFILIEGREGIGKSEGAKAWCAQRPGKAVYVRLESGTDEATLFRSIARAVGTACSYGRKATEMRARIQDALQPGQMMLVLDEAHFLWPQSERSGRSAPKRVDWLRTALVDFGVPVALISTPQYFSRACEKFLKGGWNANQIQRRLAHTVVLPEQISVLEMKSVAKYYFPKASNSDLLRIALTAASELGFLTVMMHLRKRVDFVAAKRPGRPESEYIDQALAVYVKAPAETPLPVTSKTAAGRLQSPGNTSAGSIPSRAIAPANLSTTRHDQPVLTVT